MSRHVLIVVLLLFGVEKSAAMERNWTSSSGTTITATYLSYDPATGEVRLRGVKELTLKLRQLSTADQLYVIEQYLQQREAAFSARITKLERDIADLERKVTVRPVPEAVPVKPRPPEFPTKTLLAPGAPGGTPVVSPPNPPDAGPVVAVRPPAAGGPRKRALIVGPTKYEHLSPLAFPSKDVLALKEELCGWAFADADVVVMHDNASEALRPNRVNILRELARVANEARSGDLVLVAFSGHGVALEVEGQITSFLCPADARLDLPGSLVAVADVYRELGSCAAKHKLVLVDACRDIVGDRSGVQLQQQSEFDKRARQFSAPDAKGIAVLVSCKTGERSWEDEELNHGIFMYQVIQYLHKQAALGRASGVATVTLAELWTQVAAETKRHMSSDKWKKLGVEQTPHLTSNESPNIEIGRIDIELPPALITPFAKHTQALTDVAFFPDGSGAATSDGSTGRIWNVRGGVETGQFAPVGFFWRSTTVQVAPSAKIVGFDNAPQWSTELWDVGKKAARSRVTLTAAVGGRDAFRFAHDETRLAVGLANGLVHILETKDLKSIAEYGHEKNATVTSVSFSPDGRFVISGSAAGEVMLCDARTGEFHDKFRMDGRPRVWMVRMRPDGQIAMLLGDVDKPAQYEVWNLAKKRRISTATVGVKVQCVDLSPDFSAVLCGEPGGELVLWRSDTGIKLHEFLGEHEGAVTCVRFSPDGQYALSGGFDHKVNYWRLPKYGVK